MESHVLWIVCLLLSYTCLINLIHAIIIVIVLDILCRLNIINITMGLGEAGRLTRSYQVVVWIHY